VEKDDRLKPLLILMQAAAYPDRDMSEDIALATEQMVEYKNQERVPSKRVVQRQIRAFEEINVKQIDSRSAVEIVEIRDKPMLFSSWGKTVQFTPSHTLVVRTIEGVCATVKWAAQKGKRVRVSGFRHTWTYVFLPIFEWFYPRSYKSRSELYGKNDDVLIMFLPYPSLVDLPHNEPSADWKSELIGINIVESVAGHQASAGHAFCKIMAGTTNDMFREWCFREKKWCLPFNVIMVEITFGGANAPICHGSGFTTTTLSDLVMEVQYVDAQGEVQTINNKNELLAASGCFGLLGVVISITLLLDDMAVVEMMPVKTHFGLAVPFPKNYKLPDSVKKVLDDAGITEGSQRLEKAREEFINRCKNDYYLEWFWFPYQTECWINTWKSIFLLNNATVPSAYCVVFFLERPMTPADNMLLPYPSNTGILPQASFQKVRRSRLLSRQ
jgi:hypothetical protein